MKEEIIINPISGAVKKSLEKCNQKLNIAVPFISSFLKTVLKKEFISKIIDKRIIVRFEDTTLNSFDVPTLRYLIDCGFKIVYNNEIHLKLYIIDNDTYISSSNFTKGGFEDNIELTVKISDENNSFCNDYFEKIWAESSKNIITERILNENIEKYEFLKKRESYRTKPKENVEISTKEISQLNIQSLIDEIFKTKYDYSSLKDLIYEASKLRENRKGELIKGFNKEIFYVPENHSRRRDNLFYDFVYGYEEKLAGTGLRELQFKIVFEHPEFKNVIHYIFPEIIGYKPWNLNDKETYKEFCIGIFDFNIPQYSESLPIRLASYFYPQFFIPIFKLEHLKKMSETLGLKTNAKTKGEKLFAYNEFLINKMNSIPEEIVVKSRMLYTLMYAVELHSRMVNGEPYETVLNSYKQIWKKNHIKFGFELLTKLKIIKPSTQQGV